MKASRIVRAVDILLKDGKSVIFNDPLVDGGRSIKVWGWGDAEYSKAVVELKLAGYDVARVKTANKKERLWVQG